MKKALLSFVFCLPIILCAQKTIVPQTFLYNNKNYLVYPVRAANIQDIPPTGFGLPDGEYIIFSDYIFKPSNRKKIMELKDSTRISANINIKNNLAEGPAEFFHYDYDAKTGKKAKWDEKNYGNYAKGLKEGLWSKVENNILTQTETYKNGLVEGVITDYYNNGKLSSKTTKRNGTTVDTIFNWLYSGKLHSNWDIIDKEKDTVLPEKNFMDFIFEEYSVKSKMDRYVSPKTFYKEYDFTGKLKNEIRYTMGRNPVFDTLHWYNTKFFLVKKADSIYVVHQNSYTPINKHNREFILIEHKIKKSKYLLTFREDEYEGKFLRRKLEVKTDEKRRITDSVITVYTDRSKIDKNSWEDVVLCTITLADHSFKKYHCIPALGYVWEENSNGYTNQKPIRIDTVQKKINSVDSTGYSGERIRVAQEIRLWENDREDMMWQHSLLRKKFAFLKGVTDNDIFYYLSPSTKHTSGDFGNLSRGFTGSVWANTWLEDKKPMSGKFVFSDSYEVLDKNKFSSPAKYFSGAKGTIEAGYLLNGVKNGRWERMSLQRKKNITENFDESFRKNPQSGEYYIVADFKDGEIEGMMRSWNTEGKTEYFNGKYIKKIYTYMDYEANYSEGYLHGPYKTFHYNSKLRYSVNMNMGKIDGRAERYNDDGKLRSYVTYKNDSLNGPYGEFMEGKKSMEANFDHNNLQGKFILYSYKTEKVMLELQAEKNIIKKRTLFFDNGELKEEIIYTDSSAQEFVKGITSLYSYLEMLSSRTYIEGKANASATLRTFYENGKTLAEGKLIKGVPSGIWKFYNVAGNLINETVFKDTTFYFPGKKDSMTFTGVITGYFNNGKIRCKGFINEWQSGYDCSTHQDITKFDVFYTDVWNYEGLQQVKNGSGIAIVQDENGMKTEEGTFDTYKRTGTWKYFDPNQKLHETGCFVNGKKDGLWYFGDLENLNFEDAACFDPNNSAAQEKLEYSKKKLSFQTKLYKAGEVKESKSFNTDLNKTRQYYKPYRGRRFRHIDDF